MGSWTLITQVGPFGRTRRIVDGLSVQVPPARALEERGFLREGSVTFSIDGRPVSAARLAEPVHAGARVVAIERPSNALSLFSAGLKALNPFDYLSNIPRLISYGNPYYGVQALNALRNAFIPSLPGDGDAGGTRRSAVGVRNRLPQHEPVPQVLGRHRMHPDQAAATYVEVSGKQLYQRILLTCGPGPIEFEDLRIGDDPVLAEGTAPDYTDVQTGDGHFDGLLVEFRKGTSSDADLQLFSSNHVTTAIGVQLTKPLGWVVRRTPENVTEINVIIAYPQGLSFTTSNGNLRKATVRTKVEYRAADADPDDPWTSVGQIQTTARATNAVYDDRRWNVPEGQYDVRLKRVTAPAALGVADRSDWHSLQCLRAGEPVALANVSKIAILVRLSGRFSSLVENVNVIAKSVVKDWNGSTWVERVSQNPASLFRHVLQGDSNRRPVADARIDLTALEDWHDACETDGRTCSMVLRGRQTVPDVLRQICLAGRASFNLQDGRFSVVRDVEQSTPVAHLTPRNSYGFRSSRTFITIPDGFEVPFLDADADWKETRRKVVRAGVSEASATDFDRLDLPGVTDPDQVFKEARYHLAVLIGRPETIRVGTDFEHLELQRGDLVAVTNDVLQHGICAGRVKSVTTDGGGDCTSITVDEPCEMELAKSYGVVVRKDTGTPITRQVNTVAGANTTLTFSTAIPAAQPHPEVGDLFQFGIAGSETAQYILDRKVPNEEMGATLELLPEAPTVYTADQGTVPQFDPQITVTPDLPLRPPPPPRISHVRRQVSRARSAAGRDGGGTVEIVLASGGTQSAGGSS